MDVTMPYQWLGHHIYCDNLFTSVHLVETLLERRTYLCGTFRANMSGIPVELKKPGHLQQGQSIKRQKGNIVATVWKDRRDVRVISSNVNPTDGHVQREAPRNRNQVCNKPIRSVMMKRERKILMLAIIVFQGSIIYL